MDKTAKKFLKEKLKKKKQFTTKQLLLLLAEYYPDLKLNTYAWKINQLKNEGLIQQIGRGLYAFDKKPDYEPIISKSTKELYTRVKHFIPCQPFVMYDSHTFLSLIDADMKNNLIFFMVNRHKLDLFFYDIRSVKDKVFMNPCREVYEKHIYPSKEAVILLPLLSDTPLHKFNGYYTLALEAILVNVFIHANTGILINKKNLKMLYHKAFNNYNINIKKLLRYAARRERRNEIEEFLKNNITEITL